jgi:hypothetical protein
MDLGVAQVGWVALTEERMIRREGKAGPRLAHYLDSLPIEHLAHGDWMRWESWPKRAEWIDPKYDLRVQRAVAV